MIVDDIKITHVKSIKNEVFKMTVLIALRHLSGVTIIADSRVSFGTSQPVHDGLQKLYQVGDKIVFGFTGPLAGAFQVIQEIKKNRNRNSRSAKNTTVRDVERWIRYAYQNISFNDRRGLSFLIARSDNKRLKSFGKHIQAKYGIPDFPETELFTLEPSQKNPAELIKIRQVISVIGVKPEFKVSIKEVFLDSFTDLLQSPGGQNTINLGINAIKIASSKHPDTIGGLFQCAVMDSRGIGWASYDNEDVSLTFEDGRYMQHNKRTGQKIPLLTVWEWGSYYGFKQPPPNATTFEI